MEDGGSYLLMDGWEATEATWSGGSTAEYKRIS
jgi:hypothetical protein